MGSSQATPFVERLPCKLAAHEKDLKADELARALCQRDALVLEKGIAAQRYAKSIKELERKVGDLAEDVRNGYEYREVKVTERRDFNRNVVEIVRLDTHEVCGQRAMRGDERQLEMLPKNGGAAGDAAQLELAEAADMSRFAQPESAHGAERDVDDELYGPDDDDEDDDDEEEEHDAEPDSAH